MDDDPLILPFINRHDTDFQIADLVEIYANSCRNELTIGRN